jgi:hypothetical protein
MARDEDSIEFGRVGAEATFDACALGFSVTPATAR